MLQLAATLREAILALPAAAQAPAAVEIGEIRAGGNLPFERVEGIRAESASAGGDMTFRDVTRPEK